jgi:hypothetical protein
VNDFFTTFFAFAVTMATGAALFVLLCHAPEIAAFLRKIGRRRPW